MKLQTENQEDSGAGSGKLEPVEGNDAEKEIKLSVIEAQVSEDEIKRLVQIEAMKLPDMDIAISGIAGRFPKSDSVNEFEENLRQGIDMINDNDDSRYPCRMWGLPPRAGRLKDLTRFDWEFFGIESVDHAHHMDSQERILYEVVYESILDAGLNPAELRGSRTGLYFGFHCTEFEKEMAHDPSFKGYGYYGQFGIKMAQYFDLRGVNVTIDAACASVFVGLQNAADALEKGLIDNAIVCCSLIPINPMSHFVFLQMQMLSPTGYSRFLDSRADGYVKSEACISVVMQRKHLAKRNYMSIMAIMENVDGYKPEGITFPADKSQESLIREAKEKANVSTNHIEYLEAHGTGTPAGDPQEARAVANVYFPEADHPDQRLIGPLLVGSVKTNMGHSEGASGLSSLAKVALMLENEIIYKGLHYDKPNANIESLREGKLKFVSENRELRAKIVPMSCYGFGGANVHAILRANHRPAICEEDIRPEEDNLQSRLRLVVMFGRSEQTVGSFFDQILDRDTKQTRFCLSDDFLALVNELSRDKIDRLMNHRGYLIVDRATGQELARDIEKCELQRAPDEYGGEDLGRKTHFQECKRRPCNLILSGVGSQWRGMGAGLVDFKPFWSTIKRLAPVVGHHGIDLERLLIDGDLRKSTAETFVAIVAFQVALVELVQKQLRVNNLDRIVGHSLGEVSCAYADGRITEGEAVLVAYQMGKTLDELKDRVAGLMVALQVGEKEAKRLIASLAEKTSSVRVCCINGPESVTISGSKSDIEYFLVKLHIDHPNIVVYELDFDLAMHNEVIMTDDIKRRLTLEIGKVLPRKGENGKDDTHRKWISSFDMNGHEAIPKATGEYFASCLCEKVDFVRAIEQLEDDSIALELGAHGLFEMQISQRLRKSNSQERRLHYVKLMRRGVGAEENQQVVELLANLGKLYQAGATFNLNNFYAKSSSELFPVRRQTPSLSSLFKWNHREKLFVPRYPNHFSKSSEKCEIPIDVFDERDKFLLDHCIEGRVLLPATSYLYHIWRVFSFTKRQIRDACFQGVENELMPIEFRNVRLLRAVLLGNRASQIYVHFEEATGRFEVKEGGSVVADGYAFTPVENPNGLQYEHVKDMILAENPVLELSTDDIYKQFRVSGYDYGEKFRNIQQSSYDGHYCQVKHNGHFVALTDNILQSIFLAVTQYSPSGGLFLPTRIDYVRFQPDVILKKMHEAKVPFDVTESTMIAKREVTAKLMQKEIGFVDKNSAPDEENPKEETAKQENGVEEEEGVEEKEAEGVEKKDEEPEEKHDCIFEVYCDPVTGIIVTDGIEMRGIKATPAPRRSENSNEILMESYQFVPDFENPIDDEPLTRFKSVNQEYVRVCNGLSMELMQRLLQVPHKALSLKELQNGDKELVANSDEIINYMKNHLESSYRNQPSKSQASNEIENGKESSEEEAAKDVYDIKKNGNRTLMSVLDQLTAKEEVNAKEVRELVHENRVHLVQDLIQSPTSSERLMRSLAECVIENCCQKKMKLKLMEVNVDDGLLKDSFCELLTVIEPTLSLDYSLAHPDIERLKNNKLLTNPNTKTYTLKDLHSLFADQQLNNFDLIVYKDISCYSLPKQVIEQNGISPVMSSLNSAVRHGGYVMMIMREKLTLAERILLALSEPELVGLSRKHLEQMKASPNSLVDKLSRINDILASRCKTMIAEAVDKNHMLHLAKKSDFNGCTVLLFKRTCSGREQTDDSMLVDANPMINLAEEGANSSNQKRLILRITHSDKQQLAEWLDMLKNQFKKPEPKEQQDSEQQQLVTSEPQPPEVQEDRVVWLCGIATKQQELSGVVGMMQALRRELGSSRLRCYYDAFTFKNRNEPVSEQDIENSSTFQEALRRDHLWNCIDSDGKLGSFRHFTINDYLAYSDYNCSRPIKEDTKQQQHEVGSKEGAYVGLAQRGDLSSFTWFEAPFKHLDEKDRKSLIRVAYSALNFRDIMLATGRLPLDILPLRSATSDCLIGLEFSGYDALGRRVMGMVSERGLATHILCPEKTAMKIQVPDWLDLRAAATIPVVYATAAMALIHRGRMQRGESILIHAGSGGVGQAAIRLALHFGLEVFTTVGTDEKRRFLVEEFAASGLREDRIFSSRTCDFEYEILKATRGRGVDLVLNSLADDKLQASINCLTDGGRFLEIGKYDMAVDARLELLKLDTNKTFHGIHLDKFFEVDAVTPAFADQLRCVLTTLQDGLEKGYVRPIKYTTFKRNQVEEAFRYMATGKHIGKIILEIDSSLDNLATKCNGTMTKDFASKPFTGTHISCIPRFQASPVKSYVITGGLGGFGLELTKWLVSRGAHHIVITSRSGLKTGYQRATLRRLESNDGAKFLVVDSSMADATTRDGAEKLRRLAEDFAPSKQIDGIFHLAMVLKDTLLENMSTDDFESVFKPKAETCGHLDAIMKRKHLGYRLEYFVAFSSITSGKGNAGQSNYAYANSVLERVCDRRRREGEHGLAIQWGAIGDVGAAYETFGGNNVVIGGTIPQRMPSCLATLGKLLCSPFSTCLSVLPVSRSKDRGEEKGDLVGAIMHVLGIKDASKVSEQATLGDLGLDSLMAVEIRQYIEREYDKTLSVQEIRSLTIAKIREISDSEKPVKS